MVWFEKYSFLRCAIKYLCRVSAIHNNNRNNIVSRSRFVSCTTTTTCLQRTSSENIVNTVSNRHRYISFPVCIACKFYGNTTGRRRKRSRDRGGGLIIYLSVSPRERRPYLNATVVSHATQKPRVYNNTLEFWKMKKIKK